jgi:hypothetical protein
VLGLGQFFQDLESDDSLMAIHQRSYEVCAYRVSPWLLRVRGVIQDRKPPGLYIEDDPEPLEVHPSNGAGT